MGAANHTNGGDGGFHLQRSARVRVAARGLCLFAAFSLTAACPARMAGKAASTAVRTTANTTATAVRATGRVVGGTINVLTFSDHHPSDHIPSEVIQ